MDVAHATPHLTARREEVARQLKVTIRSLGHDRDRLEERYDLIEWCQSELERLDAAGFAPGTVPVREAEEFTRAPEAERRRVMSEHESGYDGTALMNEVYDLIRRRLPQLPAGDPLRRPLAQMLPGDGPGV